MDKNDLSAVLNLRARAARAGTPSSDPRSPASAPAETPRQVAAERLLGEIQAMQRNAITLPTKDWI